MPHRRKTVKVKESDWKVEDHMEEIFMFDESGPKTIGSWVMGFFNAGNEHWFMDYLDAPVFKEFSMRLKHQTGFDAHILIGIYSAYVAGTNVIPWVFSKAWDHSMSSVTLDAEQNQVICRGLMTFVAGLSSSYSTSWINFKGQHTKRLNDKGYLDADKQSRRFFWYDNTFYMLHREEKRENPSFYEEYNYMLTISCFGLSDEPVRKLIKFCEDQITSNEGMKIITHCGNSNSEHMHKKRQLDTIDMDECERDKLRQDAADYFHESSRSFYEAAGTPYRRGYLLTGPPGTGKTSLAMAVASENNVPLVIVKLGSLTDTQLESIFDELPYQCVVLMEDIDSAGVVRAGSDAVPASNSIDNLGSEDVSDVIKSQAVKEIVEAAVENATERIRVNNKKFLEEMRGMQQQNGEQNTEQQGWGDSDYYESCEDDYYQEGDGGPKQLTLSALLNAIDGAGSQEGRLLIMTTNAPKSLDPALYRNGRVDKIVQMSYSTRQTAVMTFKRIFGQDPLRRHEAHAIQRFAKTFGDHFPEKSTITPAELSNYCLTRRANPVKAIKEFSEYIEKIKNGEDIFTYDINDIVEDETDEDTNRVGELNEGELYEKAEDFLPERNTKPKPMEQPPQRKSWGEWLGLSQSTAYDNESVYNTTLCGSPLYASNEKVVFDMNDLECITPMSLSDSDVEFTQSAQHGIGEPSWYEYGSLLKDHQESTENFIAFALDGPFLIC